MADILLSYEVGIELFVSLVILLLLTIGFFNTLYILKNYDKSASTELQYSLEKRSYLLLTIIQLSLIAKLLLLPFFTYILEKLSHIIPGAMCGAGVISANIYGEPLIVLKILLVILSLLWLTLNKEDLHSKNFKYFRAKMWFFAAFYTLFLAEIILELLFFTNLSTLNPVMCCSVLYANAEDSKPLPFGLSMLALIVSFYATYLLILISAWLKNKYVLLPLTLLFTYISHLSIVYFFSTYIYQLPTHTCPYCLLQGDYYFIGYFIYTSLIVALFYSLSASLFSFAKSSFKYLIIYYTLFVFFISIHFWVYLIINRTFL